MNSPKSPSPRPAATLGLPLTLFGLSFLHEDGSFSLLVAESSKRGSLCMWLGKSRHLHAGPHPPEDHRIKAALIVMTFTPHCTCRKVAASPLSPSHVSLGACHLPCWVLSGSGRSPGSESMVRHIKWSWLTMCDPAETFGIWSHSRLRWKAPSLGSDPAGIPPSPASHGPQDPRDPSSLTPGLLAHTQVIP